MVVTGIQLYLCSRPDLPVQGNCGQLTADFTVPDITFPLFIQQIQAIAESLLFIHLTAKIQMRTVSITVLISYRHPVQRILSRSFGDKIKLAGRAGRAVNCAGQAVHGIQPLQHFHRKRGSGDNIQAVQSAVFHHAALHSPALRTAYIHTAACLHLRRRQIFQHFTDTFTLLITDHRFADRIAAVGNIQPLAGTKRPHINIGRHKTGPGLSLRGDMRRLVRHNYGICQCLLRRKKSNRNQRRQQCPRNIVSRHRTIRYRFTVIVIYLYI